MTKLLFILLAGLLFEALGVNLIKAGLTQIDGPENHSAAAMARFAGRAIANSRLLLGVLFEAIFFASLVYLLSQANVSLIWPLTSLGFVITTLVARFLQHEQVSSLRWFGVVLITVGAVVVGWSEALSKGTTEVSSKPLVSGSDTEGTAD